MKVLALKGQFRVGRDNGTHHHTAMLCTGDVLYSLGYGSSLCPHGSHESNGFLRERKNNISTDVQINLIGSLFLQVLCECVPRTHS